VKLKRSNDRKVTNLVTPGGNVAIANTFGLPSGKAFSCPGATSVCESVCYAGKIERLRKSVSALLMHNWELLRDADEDTAHALLAEMVGDFVKDCDRRKAEKLFRIHWDGDFFSEAYTAAWVRVIRENPETRFWVYTRTAWAVPMLRGLDNLSLYFSTDEENLATAGLLAAQGVKLAVLAPTFAEGQGRMRQMVGKVGAKCPENTGQMPLITAEGSACVRCGLCVDEKANIVFSATKR
jgi:hypothetical protein